MIDFIQKYFIEPIYQGTGYNVYNTVVYGLLLGLGIIIVDGLLRRLKVKVDINFYIATLPFLTLASLLRSLTDARILPISFFFITPGIFLTIFFVTLGGLLAARIIEKKRGIRYHKSMLILGLILIVPPSILLLLNIFIWSPLIIIVGATLASSAILFALFRIIGIDKKETCLMGSAHMLDASATFVGIQFYGYWEEHIFENYLISLGGPLVIFPLKIIVLLLIIYVLERIENNSFWYFAIFLLGYAPGLRDTFKIMLLG
jgi:uncharacterized membrane protein